VNWSQFKSTALANH